MSCLGIVLFVFLVAAAFVLEVSGGASLNNNNNNNNNMAGYDESVLHDIRERTLLLIKPDGLQRGLVSEVIGRFERKGLKLVALKLTRAPERLLRLHYRDVGDRPFFDRLVKYMSSGPLVAAVWEGRDAVAMGAAMKGGTSPLKSAPGTIRGDLAVDVERSVVHVADSIEFARREIDLWFAEDEILDWEMANKKWMYDLNLEI